MDEVFQQFQTWFLHKKTKWDLLGIQVDEAGLSEFGHDYDVMFQRTGITFRNIDELDCYEKDFIDHITRVG